MATFTSSVVLREVVAAQSLSSYTGLGLDCVADGVTGNYDALTQASYYIAVCPYGQLYFGAGTYYIEKYIVAAANAQAIPPNRVTNIYFDELPHVQIQGVKDGGNNPLSIIQVNGTFLRSWDNAPVEPRRSYIDAVTPFFIRSSSFWDFDGIKVNGGVATMTRDIDVVEGGGLGLYTAVCTDYTVTYSEFSWCACDGVLLGAGSVISGTYIADKRAYLSHVTGSNNARNGLTIAELRGFTGDDVVFTLSGVTGAYGGHSPKAGCDVEPDIAFPTVDVRTGEIEFNRAEFSLCDGSQFVSATGENCEGITIHNKSKIISKTGASQYTVILAVVDGVIDDCDIDTVDGAINPSWGFTVTAYNTTITNNRIRCKNEGILAAVDGHAVLIESNDITNYRDTALGGIYCPNITGDGVTFRDNDIFIPKEAWDEIAHGNDSALLTDGVLSENNRWATDLVPGAVVRGVTVPVGPPEAFFAPNYGPAGGPIKVHHDWFTVGFHPDHTILTWDPADPYDKWWP